MNLHQITAIVGGSLVGRDTFIKGVSVDSRADNSGKLFIALKGERFDGHDFCQQAVDNGAVAVLVERAVEVDVPQLIGDDGLAMLRSLAEAWLRQCAVTVIAITGSNGKTTIKNMLHAVLSQSHQCFATPGNFNNEIGLPLSLLQLAADDEFAVLEMGAAQIGDIAYLTAIAKPDVALISNVSNAHIGRFGSVANIAQGKSEIYQALDSDGLAVINADDEFAATWINELENGSNCEQLLFGSGANSQVQWLGDTEGMSRYALPEQQNLSIKLPIYGDHNRLNAAAVIAVAVGLQVSLADIQSGLECFENEAGRLQLLGEINGVKLIDDCYNANLASVKAAIDVLSEQPQPTVLVLGEMAELGDYAEQLHHQAGSYATAQKIDRVLAVGSFAKAVCDGVDGICHYYQNLDSLRQDLQQDWPSGGTLLVKGSRAMKMERLIADLTAMEKIA